MRWDTCDLDWMGIEINIHEPNVFVCIFDSLASSRGNGLLRYRKLGNDVLDIEAV